MSSSLLSHKLASYVYQTQVLLFYYLTTWLKVAISVKGSWPWQVTCSFANSDMTSMWWLFFFRGLNIASVKWFSKENPFITKVSGILGSCLVLAATKHSHHLLPFTVSHLSNYVSLSSVFCSITIVFICCFMLSFYYYKHSTLTAQCS